MLCIDLDMAFARHGEWVDRRLRETREVNAPTSKGKRPKMQVPKYKTLGAALGIDPEEVGDADVDGFSKEELEDIGQKVDDLRRDPAALAEFLKV